MRKCGAARSHLTKDPYRSVLKNTEEEWINSHFLLSKKTNRKPLKKKKTHRNREDAGASANNITFIKKKKNREDRDRLRWELTRLQIKFFKKKSSFLYFGGRWRESKCIVNSLLCRCRDACLSVEVSGIYQGVF